MFGLFGGRSEAQEVDNNDDGESTREQLMEE